MMPIKTEWIIPVSYLDGERVSEGVEARKQGGAGSVCERQHRGGDGARNRGAEWEEGLPLGAGLAGGLVRMAVAMTAPGRNGRGARGRRGVALPWEQG